MAADPPLIPEFIPGARVLIRAVVIDAGSAGPTEEDRAAGAFHVKIPGVRPPFTNVIVMVNRVDLYGPDDTLTADLALEIGDRVTDERGQEFEVMGIRERDDKAMIAVLWSASSGAGWDFLGNLARAAPDE